jgi:hypothetical protein
MECDDIWVCTEWLDEMTVALFQQMQPLNVQPNPITISSTLSACAQLAALSMGK